MNHEQEFPMSNKMGFSLIEVVIAIGIFLVTVLALVGLLGPTLQSVDEVEKTDEVSSIVNTVNAFLHSSDAISTGSNFETIFGAVAAGNSATLFVYQAYRDNSEAIQLRVGFEGSIAVADATKASVTATNLEDAAGTIYRVVLTPSSVIPLTGTNPSGTPVTYRSSSRDTSTDTYTLSTGYANYWEGSFAMEVRIYAEDPGPTFTYTKAQTILKDKVPVFTYNTAVVR